VFKQEIQPELFAQSLPVAERKPYLLGIESNRLRFFCPNGAQEDYITTVGNSLKDAKLPIIMPTFANGVGKSTATVQIIANLTMGVQNGWFNLPLFTDFPYKSKNIWYCSTGEAIKETVVPMFEELFKGGILEENYDDKKDGKPWVARLLINGWEIHFKTFDQDPKTYESSTVSMIVADEPMPESLWKAVKSRRRGGCIVLLPMTPLYCPPYIVDEIQKASEEGIKGYFHIEADVYSACTRRGVRGHLDPDIIDEMVASYSEEEKQARAYGKFMFFSGRIYPTISKATHEVTPDQVPIHKHALLLHVADPHDARPFATAWVAKNPDGRWIFMAETPLDQSMPFWEMKRTVTLKDECLEFKKVETDVLALIKEQTGAVIHPQAIYRVLDRHFGWQTRGHSENQVKTTMADLLVAVGSKIGMPLVFTESYSSNDKAGEITVGHKMGTDALTKIGDYPGVVFYAGTTYHMMNSLTHYIKERVEGKRADKIASASGNIVEKFKDHADVYRMAIGTQIQAEIPEPTVPTIDAWADSIDGGVEVDEEYADAFGLI
jgi:hypothetical protein